KISGSAASGFTVTNSHGVVPPVPPVPPTPPTPGKSGIDISVVKVWSDQDDKDGIRPESVTVRLLADGEDTGKSLTLSKANGWRGGWEELKARNGGKTIVYTVVEDEVEGYEVSVSGSVSRGFTVTNTHETVTPPPETPVREDEPPTEEPPVPEEPPLNPDVPKTGEDDELGFWKAMMSISAMAAAALGAVYVSRRRREQ
ncbi:MAG: Cna B-type domain-containing protein, partial [Firmicutes bacterium]|nr:Cna B-type domain-containing protein [Bacillota bacterium]